MATLKLSDPTPAHEIVLTKVRKGMAMQIGQTTINSLKLSEEYVPYIAGRIVKASFDVLADKIADDTYTTYFTWKTPKTAWQLYKKQHMPRWFKKRWPVQYEPHTYKRLVKFTRFAEYPRANIAIPKDNDKLFIQTLGGLEVIRDEVRDVN